MTVLIAGGGVAGAAAACLLGRRATLIERESGPHDKVCGEFVSWEAQDALRHLGVEVGCLGAAAIRVVRLVHGGTVTEATLPRPGAGLTRRALDEALLARASSLGATILRGRAVRRLVPGGLEVDGVGRLEGCRVLLATGKHDLRGVRRRARAGALIGLKMHLRLAPDQGDELAGAVEVLLFPGGYAGLQHVEGGLANLCLLIRRPAFEAAGATWDGVVASMGASSTHIARRLAHATAHQARPVSIFRVPYGFVHRPAVDDFPHVERLGDQMGVIPSFSGDGMAIALHTAFAAASLEDAGGYHARMRGDLRGQIARAMVVHRAGQAIPAVVARAAKTWPGALGWIARLTRVAPDRLAWR